MDFFMNINNINMMQIDKEKILNKYPLPATIDDTEIILKQMKYSISKN